MDALIANFTKPSLDGKSISVQGNGTLCDLSVWNGSGSTRYLMLFDGREQPVDGSRPKRQWTIPTLTTFDGIFPCGRPFKSGCTLIMSSQANTLVAIPKGTEGDALMEASFFIQ